MARLARPAMRRLAPANATLACGLMLATRAVAAPQDAGPVEVRAQVLVAPAPVRFGGGVPAGDDEALAPLIEQFTPQIRPILRTELHFAKAVCEPTPEQQKALARDGHLAFTRAVKQYASAQQKLMQGNWRGPAMPDPRKLIRKGMLDAVKAHLSPEQVARYQAELDAREADRKRSAIRNLVATLDDLLVLTEEQRPALEEALARNWNEAWCGPLDAAALSQSPTLPALPDKVLGPILTPTQKRVWTGAQKGGGQTITIGFSDLITFGGGEMEADPLDEAAIDEARQASAPPDRPGD